MTTKTWKIEYHPGVGDDLTSLGKAEARRILKVIDTKIRRGQPDKLGKPLSKKLAGYRRIRVGNTRIIYKAHKKSVTIFILAVGPRDNNAIYIKASKRS